MGGRGSDSGVSPVSFTLLPDSYRNTREWQYGHEDWKGSGDISDILGVPLSEAYDYFEAVYKFTGSWYHTIRGDQRNGNPTPEGEALEEFISKAPKWDGGNTYRGITVYDKSLYDALSTPGAVIDPNGGGTASWSSSLGVAQGFSGWERGASIVFVNEGPQSRGTSIKNLSQYQPEKEVLVSKDARYRVRSNEMYDNIMLVYVSEVI